MSTHRRFVCTSSVLKVGDLRKRPWSNYSFPSLPFLPRLVSQLTKPGHGPPPTHPVGYDAQYGSWGVIRRDSKNVYGKGLSPGRDRWTLYTLLKGIGEDWSTGPLVHLYESSTHSKTSSTTVSTVSGCPRSHPVSPPCP